MPKQDINPLEEMTELLADDYVEMVYELTQEFAPIRPWWHPSLSPDQQLWRWISGPREEILVWIFAAGAHMGWEGAEEILSKWETLFTDPAVVDIVPPRLQAEVPIAALEMVQAAGPQDAGNHVRKMERMVEGRMEAMQALEDARASQPNIPEPPEAPAPLPTSLNRSDADQYPYFGGVPQEDREG